MGIVFVTAFTVGGATILGSVLGFFLRRISQRFEDFVMSFAAGVMLSASILGLILPSVASGGKWGILHTLCGIGVGAVCISCTDRFLPYAGKLIGTACQNHAADKVLLFAAAIAIHNFPEGLAAGVSFGTGNVKDALLIAGGIALQNVPEGMVTVIPLLAAGFPPKKALQCGIVTGIIEIAGTLLGYYAVTVISAILPFALAFAGGTMLFVIADEMIPETHGHGNEHAATYALLIGFCLMMVSDLLLG